jgi:hypothetical protein
MLIICDDAPLCHAERAWEHILRWRKGEVDRGATDRENDPYDRLV